MTASPAARGAFTICSFWLVSALVEIGEHPRAHRLCEKLLSYASPLGLYGEELDPDTGRHLGNYPQAFTHLALINAVMHVIRSEHGTAPILARPAVAADGDARDGHGERGERERRDPARRAAGARGVRRGRPVARECRDPSASSPMRARSPRSAS